MKGGHFCVEFVDEENNHSKLCERKVKRDVDLKAWHAKSNKNVNKIDEK